MTERVITPRGGGRFPPWYLFLLKIVVASVEIVSHSLTHSLVLSRQSNAFSSLSFFFFYFFLTSLMDAENATAFSSAEKGTRVHYTPVNESRQRLSWYHLKKERERSSRRGLIIFFYVTDSWAGPGRSPKDELPPSQSIEFVSFDAATWCFLSYDFIRSLVPRLFRACDRFATNCAVCKRSFLTEGLNHTVYKKELLAIRRRDLDIIPVIKSSFSVNFPFSVSFLSLFLFLSRGYL